MTQRKNMVIGFGTGTKRTVAEGQWCKNRPSHARPPMPAVNDHVLYRSNEWFDPVDATVLAIFWQCENGFDNWECLALRDPWPMVRLRVAGTIPAAKLARGSAAPRSTVLDTWEARLEGTAGWLPPDWQKWPRPILGRE